MDRTYLSTLLRAPDYRGGMIKGESFGDRVMFYRKRLRLTQAEVAARVGTRRATVSEWEAGKREPTVSNLLRLMEALEVSCGELLQGLPVEVPPSDTSSVSPDWHPADVRDSRGLRLLERVETESPSHSLAPADFLTKLYSRAFDEGLHADEFGPLDNRRDDLLPPPTL